MDNSEHLKRIVKHQTKDIERYDDWVAATRENVNIRPISRIDDIIKSKKAPGTIKHTSLHQHDHTCLG